MSSQRVAALDGLRGIAVLMVIAGHFIGSVADTDDPLPRALLVLGNGGIGVTLFFILSGYLITSILVRERARTGRVHFVNFYIRRTLRIWPAFYVFLAVVTVLALTDVIEATGWQIASSAAFVWNYSPVADGWWLGHTWSLAVEEQFYLLWPVVLVFLGARRAVLMAVVYIVASPVIRTLSYAVFPGQRDDVWMMFHTRADALLVGCLLALLPAVRPVLWERVQRLAQRRIEYPALAVLLVSSTIEVLFGGLWVLPFGYSLTALAGGALILVAVARQAPSPFLRVLRWRALTTVGLLSYSLYLWQQLFLAPQGTGLPVVGSGVLGLLALTAAATLSYLFVERPFLNLKDRLQRPARRASPVDPAPGPVADPDGAAADDRIRPRGLATDHRSDEEDPALNR